MAAGRWMPTSTPRATRWATSSSTFRISCRSGSRSSSRRPLPRSRRARRFRSISRRVSFTARRVPISAPAGRGTDTDIALPVRTKPLFIGLHERFRDNRIEEDTEAAFDIAAVDAEGKPVTREGLHYALVREESEYHWYRSDRQYR